MNDPLYLKALMQGEISFNKKFKKKGTVEKSQLEKEIDAYVDSLELDEDLSHTALQNSKAKREAIRQEIKESIKSPEISQQIISAVKILHNEGIHYLSSEAYQSLESDLAVALVQLTDIRVKEDFKNLQMLAKISDNSMDSITVIALAKFNEERYDDCLALFLLLTILNPEYSEYWFRLGVVAQKCKNYELSSRAYAATSELDPDHLGARLFAADCFIQQNQIDDALAEVTAAKAIVAKGQIDQIWIDFLLTLEAKLP